MCVPTLGSVALLGNPGWKLVISHALVAREHEGPTFATNRTHKRQPGITTISRRREIDIHILRVKTLPKHGHEAFPADSSSNGKLDTIELSSNSLEGRRRSL